MAASKWYVVWTGKTPGIYDNWAACKAQVDGVTGARYKSFASRSEAEQAFKGGAPKWSASAKAAGAAAGAAKKAGKSAPAGASGSSEAEIDYDSISVDVGTQGNPGPIEYKGVDTQTGDILFAKGPIPNGTNNLGEFLAIVHALAYLKKLGSSKTVYSDSRTALKWVKTKQIATTLPRNESTREVWEMVDRALRWLQTNTYPNKVLKWETQDWGEIKADYGRK